MTIKIVQKFMTLNDCYKAGKTIAVKGLMVHSTACPGIMASDWYSRWNEPGLNPAKCVHGFLDDNELYQYLPWNYRGWHAGGKANDTHIGIEWCESKDLNDKAYMAQVWANGVELYTMLCKQFNLTEKNITSHKEGWGLGVASNHGDPDHWWKLHGKTMDMFRADVANALKGAAVTVVKNGWKKENDKWFFYENGNKKTGWLKDKGSWYYLDGYGEMLTGWQLLKSKWYFLNPNGDMRMGWLRYNDKWYYLNEDGSMAVGEITVKGKKYNLRSNGSLIVTTPDGVVIE